MLWDKMMELVNSLPQWVDKPVYKSRKFVYALGTFLAALFVYVLPQIVDALPGEYVLTPIQIKQISDVLPYVFVTGLALIAGHTMTDVAAIWKEGIKAKSIGEAFNFLLDTDVPVMEDLREILDAAGVKLE